MLLVNAEVTDYPAQRKKRLPRFDVLYFPKAGREDCYGVADTLTEVLEVIDLSGGDKLRGTDMSFQVTDFTYKTAEEVKMGTLKIEQGGN